VLFWVADSIILRIFLRSLSTNILMFFPLIKNLLEVVYIY
jgi:hypothetical protein